LADNHQPCGFNEAGEIVLRTPFRSLGYINAPKDAQQRFVKNPFRDDASDLIYFTGDAGRYQPDGTLEILGRLDDQVKIRGVRIEPAEVTAILHRHPLVKSCIVVARRNERDETCLVAYAVVSEQGKVTRKALTAYLRAQLPATMVPSSFVFLDKLPLTPNGKVDRSRLPMPETVQRGEFVAPRTPVEEKIAEIWAEVLRVDRVGIDDNFFDLGGHSLLATQVVSRMRTFFNYDIPLRSLFEAPTVEALAMRIIRQQAGQVSETEMERLLEELEGMSIEDVEQCYKEQLTKWE
jgi:acyl carrier protein